MNTTTKKKKKNNKKNKNIKTQKVTTTTKHARVAFYCGHVVVGGQPFAIEWRGSLSPCA